MIGDIVNRLFGIEDFEPDHPGDWPSGSGKYDFDPCEDHSFYEGMRPDDWPEDPDALSEHRIHGGDRTYYTVVIGDDSIVRSLAVWFEDGDIIGSYKRRYRVEDHAVVCEIWPGHSGDIWDIGQADVNLDMAGIQVFGDRAGEDDDESN